MSMPRFRKVFPSYDWDDVWYVNQIMNLPNIVGKENIRFVKNVPNEEVKQSDSAVKKWIDENMENCSCLILFVGEKTYQSKWVEYEIRTAINRGMAYFIVYLTGMKDSVGNLVPDGLQDPYKYHNLYAPSGTPGAYAVKKYYWIDNDGLNNIHSWIEDACNRAGK